MCEMCFADTKGTVQFNSVNYMMVFLSQVFLTKTQTAIGTVSHTHPCLLYIVSAVLMCNAERNLLKYLYCEIQGGYLFSRIIKVERQYLSMSIMT